MKILITGATGLVGAEAVRQAIVDGDITEITALTRKALNIRHSKLQTIIHADFLNYGSLKEILSKQDACLWCLGISQSQVSKEQYKIITYDYTLLAAQAMVEANPFIHFLFVSGEGADPTGKSHTLFASVKGKTENALQQIPFLQLSIVRPGGIRPVHKNPDTALINKIMIPLYPVIELVAPSVMINSVQLAKAMLYIIKI